MGRAGGSESLELPKLPRSATSNDTWSLSGTEPQRPHPPSQDPTSTPLGFLRHLQSPRPPLTPATSSLPGHPNELSTPISHLESPCCIQPLLNQYLLPTYAFEIFQQHRLGRTFPGTETSKNGAPAYLRTPIP